MLNKKYLVFVALLFCSQVCSALTITGKVTRIYPSGTDGGTINFKVATPECAAAKYLQFSLTTEVGKAWYALLLSAANSGADVRVRINECPVNEHQQVVYIFQDFGS